MLKEKIDQYKKCHPNLQRMHVRITKIHMIIKTLFSKLTQSSNEEILFIVGSGRSGNTILRKLLMENFLFIFRQKHMF